jgi:hypothetical protein
MAFITDSLLGMVGIPFSSAFYNLVNKGITIPSFMEQTLAVYRILEFVCVWFSNGVANEEYDLVFVAQTWDLFLFHRSYWLLLRQSF